MPCFHSHLKVFLATAPCDLRASFTDLWAAAKQQLGEDPKNRALFAFGNRRPNRVNILYFDGARAWGSLLYGLLSSGAKPRLKRRSSTGGRNFQVATDDSGA